MRRALLCLVAASVVMPSAAGAQEKPFAGPYAGIEAGAVDHHFVVELSAPNQPDQSFNVTQWGAGGGAFAGYDIAVAPRLRLGVEGVYNFGGRTARHSGTYAGQPYTIGLDPRWGYSVSGRIGYVAGKRVLLTAEAGYGEHRYRPIASANVGPVDSVTASFVLGGGIEYAASQRLSVRARFQHLDGSRNQFMLGVPIRF